MHLKRNKEQSKGKIQEANERLRKAQIEADKDDQADKEDQDIEADKEDQDIQAEQMASERLVLSVRWIPYKSAEQKCQSIKPNKPPQTLPFMHNEQNHTPGNVYFIIYPPRYHPQEDIITEPQNQIFCSSTPQLTILARDQT